MTPSHLQRRDEELQIIRQIAGSGHDRPVLMMNLNRYTPEAKANDNSLYKEYLKRLSAILAHVGAEILWQVPVAGSVVGEHAIDEMLAVRYPTHKAFLDLPTAPGADESYRLRARCVAFAMIYRCEDNSMAQCLRPGAPASASRLAFRT